MGWAFMIIKIFEKIKKKNNSDGFFWSIYLFLQLVVLRAISRIKSIALEAPEIYIGPGCEFIGIRHIKFGSNISINRGLWLHAVTEFEGDKFNPNITLGDRVKFSNGVHISSIYKISIGNDVLFGSNVFVSDHNHGSYSKYNPDSPDVPPSQRRLKGGGEVIIERNVWIGDNVNIVGPVIIGSGSVIAANTVVRKNIPPNSIVAGAPGKVIKTYNSTSGCWDTSPK